MTKQIDSHKDCSIALLEVLIQAPEYASEPVRVVLPCASLDIDRPPQRAHRTCTLVAHHRSVSSSSCNFDMRRHISEELSWSCLSQANSPFGQGDVDSELCESPDRDRNSSMQATLMLQRDGQSESDMLYVPLERRIGAAY